LTASSAQSEIKQCHNEVRIVRREIQEIKEMLIPEVTPSKEEVRAVEKGRQEYARGEYVEWKALRKAGKKEIRVLVVPRNLNEKGG
jgi:hypothetical protein